MITSEEYQKAEEVLSKPEYLDALRIVNQYRRERDAAKVTKLSLKQANCKHENQDSEVSEYHQNGMPDRWTTWCKDCGKIISE